MTWLKKIEPLVLHQSSELPFVILDDGVRLCFDNMYGIRESRDDFNIVFRVHPNSVKRQSANFFRLKEFPTIVPFEDVIRLNNTILDGKVIKTAHFMETDPRRIAIVKSEFLDEQDDEEYEEFVDEIEQYDHAFVLASENLTPRVRLLDDLATTIYHTGDYARTCTAIAHYVCPHKTRRYCWTRQLPEVSADCFGLQDADEKCRISEWFDYIGVPSVDINWD